jgi:hypothetical protein
MAMPDADFREFRFVPTDRYWSDVVYVQTQRQPVIPARDAPRRSRSGPVRIVRHANVCDVCHLQRAERTGVCGC